jgi:hypothetical protein
MRTLALGCLAVLALLAAGCSGDDDPAPIPTESPPATIASPTPIAPASTAVPTATPMPPVITAPATMARCPVDDDALCRFALDLQDALNANDVNFLVDRLTAEERLCQGTYFLLEDDIGCESDTDMSDPVVSNFNFASDCCFTTPAAFADYFAEYLADAENDSLWRVYALVDAHPFSDGHEVILFRGAGDEAPVVMVGTQPGTDSYTTPGIVKGSRGTFGVSYPGAVLLPWP